MARDRRGAGGAGQQVVRRPPVLFASLRGYDRSWLRADVLAGATVWAVLVPEAFAYASIAGVPPVVGLYAAVPALVAYAAFGSSRHLVVGPMSATAPLSAAAIASLQPTSAADFVMLTSVLALVTGAAGVLAGLLRMGFLAGFVSEPVLKGFIVGLALTIIIGQVPKLLGQDGGGEGFFGQAAHVLSHLGDVDPLTAAVGGAALLVLLALKRWAPAVPASLAVVLLGILVVQVLGWSDRIDVVGEIRSGLPSVGLPSRDVSDYTVLLGPAAGVLLVGFAEGLGAAKTYAVREGYDIDANRELLGLGAANLGSGLASGMVVNGSLSKTAVNGAAGARSQVSGLVVAVLSVVTLLFLTGLFEQLPDAVLAAVVIAAVAELVDVRAFLTLFRVWSTRLQGTYGLAARADFAAAVTAAVGVLVFDTLPGLVLGIIVSLLLLLLRSSRPGVRRLAGVDGVWIDASRAPEVRGPAGIVVVRVESGLFFANADHVRVRLRGEVDETCQTLVLDAQTTPFIDITAAHMLDELTVSLARDGVRLAIAGDIGQVRDVIRGAAEEGSATPTLYRTVDDAIAAATRPDESDGPRPGPENGPDPGPQTGPGTPQDPTP